jgi:hypothetical protein
MQVEQRLYRPCQALEESIREAREKSQKCEDTKVTSVRYSQGKGIIQNNLRTVLPVLCAVRTVWVI